MEKIVNYHNIARKSEAKNIQLKLRHYEKVTKFEKISNLFWQKSCFYSEASKKMGDFLKILWPF